jgi:hypothetical protein
MDLISFQPNPCQDQLSIFNDSGASIHCTIQSSTGQIIFKTELKNTINAIDVQRFAQGMYLLTFEQNGYIFTQKCMIGY